MRRSVLHLAMAGALAALVQGCELNGAPSMDSIAPVSGLDDVPVTITISGKNLRSRVITDYQDSSKSQVLSNFQVSLDHTRLGSPTLQPDGTLTAVVPPGLLPRPNDPYDLTVTDPWGRSATLEDAYTVIPASQLQDLLAGFRIATVGPQVVNQPFQITVTALDAAGATLTSYNGTANLSDSSGSVAGGTVSPQTIGSFSAGVLTVPIEIRDSAAAQPFNDVLTVSVGPTKTGQSNVFVVSPRPKTSVRFMTPALSVTAGQCSGPVRLEQFDDFGLSSVAAGNVPVTFMVNRDPMTNQNGDSPPGLRLYTDAACASTSMIAQGAVAVPAGASYTTLYFQMDVTGPLKFEAEVAAATPLYDVQVHTVNAGPADHMEFTSGNQRKSSGECSDPLTVRLRDAKNNIATATAPRIVNWSVTPPQGPSNRFYFYSDSSCLNAVVASTIGAGASTTTVYFKGLDVLGIPQNPSPLVVTAQSAGLASITVDATIVPQGAATTLAFTAAPAQAVAGTCSGAVKVEADEINGNAVPQTAPLVVGLSASAPSNALFYADPACAGPAISSVTIPVNAYEATFYFKGTLAGAFNIVPNSPLNNNVQTTAIVAAAPNKLAITTPPKTVTAGLCSGGMTVQLRDVYDNPATTGADSTITLAVLGATTPGLNFRPTSGCTGVPTSSVVIPAGTTNTTFSFLWTTVINLGSLNPGGDNVTVQATSAIVTQITQAVAFRPAIASRLAWRIPLAPGTTVVAGACSPISTVESTDAYNNVVKPAVQTGVTLSGSTGVGATTFYNDAACMTAATPVIDPNVGGGTTTSFYFKSTVAAPSPTLGSPLTVTASAGAWTPATQTFNIVPDAPNRVGFTRQPSNVVAATSISPSVQAAIQDQFNNIVTSSTASITVAIGANPGGGTLSGTLAQAAVAGVATFANLSIDKTGNVYTLTGSSTGVNVATSSAFNVTPAGATKLAFFVQPNSALSTVSIAPSVVVEARDANDNRVTSYSTNITVAIGANPSAGVLAGTTTVAASGGIATFSNLSINKAGSGYTLVASSGALTSATSLAFDILVGPAVRVAFSVQPANAVAATNISPAVQVTVQDNGGNTVTTSTASIAVAIQNNPGGGTLTGTLSGIASSGTRSFNDLQINKSGNGYTLQATSVGLASATSVGFNISAGPPNKLTFNQQPTTSSAGPPGTISPAVTVAVRDVNDNICTTSSASITMTIGTNPGPGTLAGTLSVNAASGVATFSNLSINRVAVGYTLTATSAGLPNPSVGSSAFNIIPGSANKLAFTVQPSTATAGVAISPSIQVTVRDAQDNTVTGSTASISLTISTNPGGSAITGTNPVNAASGVATFSISLNKSGTGYILTASSFGLTPAVSSTFNINPGPAAKVAFVQQPSNAAAAASIAPSVTVAIRDFYDNTVNSGATVTMAIQNNAGGGALSGTVNVPAVTGIATFSNLSINKTGVGYTLLASALGFNAISNGFNITPGPAAKVVITTDPTSTTTNTSINPAVVVQVRDANDNVATGYGTNVTLTIGNNPGNASLSGGSATPSAGVATFSNVQLSKAGTGYTLIAGSGGLATDTSVAFNIAGITPPLAAISAAQVVVPKNTNLTFDASGSSDLETDTAQLQVSWNFSGTQGGTPGSGAWTGWTTTKTDTHQYPNEGTYEVVVAVRDVDGMIGFETRFITIETDNNTCTVTSNSSGAAGACSSDNASLTTALTTAGYTVVAFSGPMTINVTAALEVPAGVNIVAPDGVKLTGAPLTFTGAGTNDIAGLEFENTNASMTIDTGRSVTFYDTYQHGHQGVVVNGTMTGRRMRVTTCQDHCIDVQAPGTLDLRYSLITDVTATNIYGIRVGGTCSGGTAVINVFANAFLRNSTRSISSNGCVQPFLIRNNTFHGGGSATGTGIAYQNNTGNHLVDNIFTNLATAITCSGVTLAADFASHQYHLLNGNTSNGAGTCNLANDATGLLNGVNPLYIAATADDVRVRAATVVNSALDLGLDLTDMAPGPMSNNYLGTGPDRGGRETF